MNRRNPPAKWVLPAVVNPPGRLCIQLQIPDERFHRAAFWGALLDLAAAYKWADDEAHTAKDVAKVWRRVIDQAVFTPCPDPDAGWGISLEDFMSQQIRISPDDSCIIQMWCIDHWEDWYNPTQCFAGGVTQPPPTEPPALGSCNTYFVTLAGNSQWVLPFPVNAGDTITVSEASGGWSDGTINWYCPNGGFYTLGACGAGSAPVGTDPIPTSSHMKLIGRIGASTYVNVYNTTYEVLTGVSDEQFLFQANDSSLEDNQGSVTFKVVACHKESAGCIVYPFDENDGGWQPIVPASGFGVWDAAGYWLSEYINVGGPCPEFEQMRIYHSYVGPLSKIIVHFDADQPGYLGASRDGAEPSAGPVIGLLSFLPGNDQIVEMIAATTVTDHIRVELARDCDADPDLHYRVHSITICP